MAIPRNLANVAPIVTKTGTNLQVSNSVLLNGGTANGVAYLNGSKVVTTGSALTFDGTILTATRGIAVNSSGTSTSGFYNGVTISGYDALGWTGTSSLVFGGYRSSQWTEIMYYLGGSEQMKLTATGLGIGTSSPAVKFQVRDTADYNFWVRKNGSTLQLAAATDAFLITVPMAFSAGSYSWAVNNGTNALNLDSSGNLGLGVTPSAWSGFKAFEFGSGNALMSSSSGYGQAYFMNNAYYNGSAYIYKNTQAAGMYVQNLGAHQFFTAPSGTAGNAISFGDAKMTLDASGNLGVGVTSVPSNQGNSITVGNTSGANINITSNSDAGTSGSPKYLDLRYLGYNNNEMARIRSWDESGSTGYGYLTFWTNNGSTLGERARITSGGNLLVGGTTDASSTAAGAVAAKVFGQGQSVSVAALNTDYSLGIGASAGILVVRDSTTGGSALWLLDTNQGAIQISNNITKTITFTFSASQWRIKQTAGSVTTAYKYTLFGTDI